LYKYVLEKYASSAPGIIKIEVFKEGRVWGGTRGDCCPSGELYDDDDDDDDDSEHQYGCMCVMNYPKICPV
jgi:hypothetical protein